MRSCFVRPLAVALFASAVLAHPAAAQRAAPAARPADVTLSPYAGLAVFGDLTTASFGGIGLSTSTGTVFGAQVGLPFSPRAALIGNVAYGSGDISIGVPVVGGVALGTTSLLMADVGLEVALTPPGAAMGGVRPFLQGGGGVMRRKLSGFGMSTKANDAAFNVGGGADLALGRNVGLRIMAKDYMGKFDLQEATAVPLRTKLTHNWMLTAGLKLDL
ncbi:MAG: outer membrane beta-barrel protein [Gemmatimonadaceae bacterium]